MEHVYHCQRVIIGVFVRLVMEEFIVNTVKLLRYVFSLINNHSSIDITTCVFPFVDNQNVPHNTCVITSDYLGGTVPWCRNALGLPKSCDSMKKIIH